MKMTDLRAKARAIFGSANPEPMPNQPNGAKALQERANARPIPTYKVGGVVKKANGGSMPKLSAAERKMGDALMMTRKGKEIMDAQKRMEAVKEMERRKKQEEADKLLGMRMKNGGKAGCYADGGDVTADRIKARMAAGNYKKGGSVEKKADGGLLDRVGRAISDIANEGKTKKYGIPVGGVPRGSAGRPARNATDGAGSGSNAPVTVTRREESVTVNPNPPKEKTVRLNEKPKYVKLNEKPKYVKLNAHKDGGKVQTSSDTARKLATEMGGMKKGGKPKDGLAVMIAIGKPMKKPVKKAMGGVGRGRANIASETGMQTPRGYRVGIGYPTTPQTMPATPAPQTMPAPPARKVYKEGGAPVKKAVGGAGKTRKGMMKG